MNHFPLNSLRRPAAPTVPSTATVRQRLSRDILWDQPVFKAPALSSPRVSPEALLFTANRLTLRAAHG